MSDWKETEIGLIPKDWQVSTLDKISELLTDGSHLSPKESFEGKYMASVKDMRYGGFDFTNCKKISDDDYQKLKQANCYPKKGDILISKDGANCLDIIFVYNQEEEIVLLSSIAIVRLKNKQYNPFFYNYYLLSPVAQKIMRGWFISGSAIPRVVLKDFKKVPVPDISFLEQKRIADVLSCLDAKIENLRRQNKTLEQIAQTLFKHWFIDFEFPNADSKPYKSSGGAMSPSELGDIPEGWRVGKLGEVVNVNSKSMNKNYPHQIIEYVDISSVGIGTLENTTQYKLSEAPSRARRLVQHGDVIWSGVRPNRKSYLFICKPIKNLVVSTGFIVLSPKKIPSSYLYAWVTTSMFVDYLTLNASGSAYPAVKAEHFEIAEIVLPSKSLLEKFHLVIDPMRVKTHENSLQIQTLTKTRDALLPKLMSGQLRVKE